MGRSVGFRLWIVVGIAGTIVGVAAVLWLAIPISRWTPSPREPLAVSLDTSGPYMILATERASKAYAEAIAEAKAMHLEAAYALFSPHDLSAARSVLREHEPLYAMVFILPDELDVNFAWEWLTLTTELDDDPFVDVRTGFITGESPTAATELVRRIRHAVEGRIALPAALVDDLGPNMQAPPSSFNRSVGTFFLPVYQQRFDVSSISHGTRGFTQERLDSLDHAGILHFGGHGYPNRIVDSINGPWVRRLKIAPCVVFNGACYTGVTARWFELKSGVLKEKFVPAAESFCLGILGTNVVGYLAALHPDHGIPVYQEMEYLAYTGAPLGDLIKHTHDGVILASGAEKPLSCPRLTDRMRNPAETPSQIMLFGTAARVLFGDPALVITGPFTAPPFQITVSDVREKSLTVKAVLQNREFKSTYTDTYHADLASDTRLFNDTARFTVDLPQGWESVARVEVLKVSARGQEIRHRLVGYGVERDRERACLHLQIDVPTSGYMASAFRDVGSTVELRVHR